MTIFYTFIVISVILFSFFIRKLLVGQRRRRYSPMKNIIRGLMLILVVYTLIQTFNE